MLSEHDSQRFRIDDEFRIAGSTMPVTAQWKFTPASASRFFPRNAPSSRSASAATCTPGPGEEFEPGERHSLGSMAEMAGGDAAKHGVQADAAHEFSTGSLSISKKFPGRWASGMAKNLDNVNAHIDSSQAALVELETKVRELKPKINDSLARAEKAIGDMRQSTLKSLDEAQASVTAYRQDALASTKDLGKTIADYKESIPEQIHDARDWSDRFMPTVAKIDNFCSRADDQLDKGIENLKASRCAATLRRRRGTRTHRLQHQDLAVAGEQSAGHRRQATLFRYRLAPRTGAPSLPRIALGTAAHARKSEFNRIHRPVAHRPHRSNPARVRRRIHATAY